MHHSLTHFTSFPPLKQEAEIAELVNKLESLKSAAAQPAEDSEAGKLVTENNKLAYRINIMKRVHIFLASIRNPR